MSWNYRVIRQKIHGEDVYGVHEVYWDGDKITGWTRNPVEVVGDTVEEVQMTLGRMLIAAGLPVIDDPDER